MLSRHRPLHRRLTRAFALFAGTMLLVTWLGSLSYFFWSERDDLLMAVKTQAAIIAAQSSAAVVFGDGPALTENLAVLDHLHGLRWAAIVSAGAAAPGRTQPHRLAQFGPVPQDLLPLSAELDRGRDVVMTMSGLTLRQAILHNGIPRAELLINIDMGEEITEFFVLCWLSLAINALFLLGGIIVFERIVRTVSMPIDELVNLAEQVATEGSLIARADTQFNDEVGQLARAFNRMLDTVAERERDLSRSQEELRALNARLRDVREAERTRISHEIHDELGQRMTAIKFELARLENAEARAKLSGMVDETIGVVRSISWELRPSVLDSLGLAAAVEWLGKDFQQRMGIRCGIKVPGAIHLAPEQATDLFRICQELLTNITRHARASRADILLDADDETVVLQVSDDGVGMPGDYARKRSLGLLGIRERSQRWQGKVEIERGSYGKGSRVRVTLPIAAMPDAPSLPE